MQHYSKASLYSNGNKQIHALHARTGSEVLLIATRTKTSDFLKPYLITTSDRPAQFFNLSIGHPVMEIAVCMEAYCILGAKGIFYSLLFIRPRTECLPSGVVQTYVQSLLKLKSETLNMILNQLRRSTAIIRND
jgi:hypothetical protein